MLKALDRLAYTGKRGMGALEYVPSLLEKEDRAEFVTKIGTRLRVHGGQTPLKQKKSASKR